MLIKLYLKKIFKKSKYKKNPKNLKARKPTKSKSHFKEITLEQLDNHRGKKLVTNFLPHKRLNNNLYSSKQKWGRDWYFHHFFFWLDLLSLLRFKQDTWPPAQAWTHIVVPSHSLSVPLLPYCRVEFGSKLGRTLSHMRHDISVN